MARPTSRDVAREAGVSQSTVSFVLNQTEGQSIPEDTRKLVYAAVRKLNYVPSAAARALKTGTSNIVLCLTPDWPVTDAMERLKVAFSDRFAEAGFACVYSHYNVENVPVSALWHQIQPRLIIAFDSLPVREHEAIVASGIALIDGLFTAGPKSPLSPVDQEEIGRLQIRHLHDRGHRRISYVSISDPRESAFTTPRQSGAEQECRRLGLPDLNTYTSDGSKAGADALLASWESSPSRSTGFAAFNDNLAISLLAAAKTRRLAVPESLAIIGVDDLSVSSLVDPPLTTIAIDLQASARILCEKILGQLAASPAVGTALETPTLRTIQRQTT